jgi:hypothetical protein
MPGQYEPEQAGDFRVAYAAHFENDGDQADREVSVADRAVWAMREAGRDMNGVIRPARAAAGTRPSGRPGVLAIDGGPVDVSRSTGHLLSATVPASQLLAGG